MTSVAKLLFPTAKLRLDTRALNETLTFAFATGTTGEALERILNAATMGPSLWKEDCFAQDLFLDDFVKRCLTVHIDGEPRKFHRAHLKQVLTRTPSDQSVVAHRQRILAELTARPDLVRNCERAWLAIEDFKRLLTSAEISKRMDTVHRQMEILRAAKASLDLLATGFETADTGIASIHQFGTEVLASEGYHNLQDLLDYEAHLATVDVRLRLGFDGQLRSFEIVRASENKRNPLYSSPLTRFWTKLRMLLRGYRAREREILGRLLYGVFDGIQRYVIGLLQIQLELEVFLSALAFRASATKRGLMVCLPSFSAADGLSIRSLFNPFLLFEEEPPVACDVDATPGSIVVITGPNSGGKTRLLQALGLCQMLAQAGLFAPAGSAKLSFSEGLFVSLIHEAHADAKEGRLGTELLRIRRLFEKLSVGSLVLLDELCSGTNPSEGEEIFELVVSLLAEVKPVAFISTHFLQFAARLARERKGGALQFLQVELDEQLEPTYKFVEGVASTSLAQKTAERLGVTRDALQKLVRQKQQEYATRHSLSEPGLTQETGSSAVPLAPLAAAKQNSADSSQ
jgi:DNA mismatch repair protein MutS2